MFQYRMEETSIYMLPCNSTNICVAQENSINYKMLFNDTHNIVYILVSPKDNRGIRNE